MKIFVISGSTASGKSDLALKFAQKIDGSIINADALQIYQELPILSAQPTKMEQEIISHYLYAALNYQQSSSVANWLKMLENTLKIAKNPIIVGGTGMYISKLFDGINEIPEISAEIRQEARNLYEKLGKEQYIEILKQNNENPDPKLDKQRLIRLYEVLKQTGKTLKSWQKLPKKYIIDPKNLIHVNLQIERQKLYQNCDLRFEKMLENGAVEEVRALIAKNPAPNAPITKTLGFIEIAKYLNNELNKEESIKIAQQKTRNYAKRQLTWFKNQCKNKNIFNNSQDALNFLKNAI